MKNAFKFLFFPYLLVLFVLFPTTTFAQTPSEDYVSFSSNVMEKYFKNKDLGQNNDISNDVSKDVLRLLTAKTELQQIQHQILGLQYNEYQIEINPWNQENWKQINNTFYLELQVITSWVNTKTSPKTTLSEILEITLTHEDHGVFNIISCYSKIDIQLGSIDELYKNELKKKSSDNEINLLLENYKQDFKIQLTKNEEERTSELENDLKSGRTKEKEEIKEKSKTSLNRANIHNWARSNFNKTNPTSASSSISYYDFSKISGSWDCTNFVSHALLAGGATRNDQGNTGIQGTTQWYFRNISNRSSSWSGVNEIHAFLTRSNPSDS